MPSVSIKAILFLHWVLTIWALLAWSVSPAYVWCNISVLALGIWAVADRQSVDAIFLFMMTLVWSCVVDIVTLAIYFELGSSPSAKFSKGMAVVNLIFKPFSAILIFQMYRDRGGEYNINFGQASPSYENLSSDDSTRQPDGHGSTAYIKPNISATA